MHASKTILPILNLAQPIYIVIIEYHQGDFDYHFAFDFNDAQIFAHHYGKHLDAHRISVFDFETYMNQFNRQFDIYLDPI